MRCEMRATGRVVESSFFRAWQVGMKWGWSLMAEESPVHCRRTHCSPRRRGVSGVNNQTFLLISRLSREKAQDWKSLGCAIPLPVLRFLWQTSRCSFQFSQCVQ